MLASDSPLNAATNTLLNTLQSAVCKIDSNTIVDRGDPDKGGVDGASFYQEYLTFVLNLSDFIEFVFQNIGKESRN